MTSTPIVKALNVRKDATSSLLTSGPEKLSVVRSEFGFQGAPSTLHDGIIITAGSATHTGDDDVRIEQLTIVSTGIL